MATISRPSVIHVAQEAAIPLPERVTIALGGLTENGQGGAAGTVGRRRAGGSRGDLRGRADQLVGPRGKHSPERRAYRHGQERRQLTLGGRRVGVQKPRARTKAGEEVELESYRLFAARDLLTQAALDRILAGLSTRRYRAGLEPIGSLEAKAISRSTVSRRFVAGTARKLQELMGRDLSGLDLLAIFIDGIETADHTIVVALGVDADGRKHPLGLWEGSTENKAVCKSLLNNLLDRGLDRSVRSWP